ncbi:MAG: hypothetical protein HY960_11045 [Ignavibacteriae bacterium]|nr:hypothetical protein [Ignavibacteriota bacterium]
MISVLRSLEVFDFFFILIGLGLIVWFIKDFKVTSKEGIFILLTLTSIGGYVGWRAWKRKRLLEELKEREDALKETEKNLQELLEQKKFAEQDYQQAKSELDAERVHMVNAVTQAEKEYAEKMEEIRNKYSNMTPEESVNNAIKILEQYGKE